MNLPVSDFEISGYRLVRLLGQGGMATVYLALQTSLGRQVAIKVLASERTPSEDVVKRFSQEARVIARLDHPHIVSIYEIGRTSSGQLYYTMPYLTNGDLAARDLREDQGAIVTVMRALLQALAYAHEQGIVHRDVKPENVLFDKLDRPLLADFGIALATRSGIRVTREGAAIGSSGYMSPEQSRSHAIDGRSDLYSLGVVSYEMLTGELPFSGTDPLAVALAHVENPVPRLPPTRRHWQALLDKALAKDPDERYQSAAEFLAALDDVQAQIEGRVPPAAASSPKAPRRLPWADWSRNAWAAVASVVVLLLFSAWMLWHGPAAPPETASRNAAVTAPASAPAEGKPTKTSAPANPVDAAGTLAAAADATLPDTADLDRLIAEGNALLKQGKLLEPAGDNAAERFMSVLKRQPERAAARAGIAAVLEKHAARVDKSLQNGDTAAARAGIEQARLLVDQAVPGDNAWWSGFSAHVLDTLQKRRTRDASEFDGEALQALREPALALGPDGTEFLRALDVDIAAVAAAPKPGTVLRDAGGPDTVFVARSKGVDHPYALAVSEVTRTEYAAFARASGRAAASCRVPRQPFSRLKKLSWSDPDFAQTPSDPVVCVSWQDARAYTRWLSQKTGATYRLPTQAEWLNAGRGLTEADACRAANVADSSKNSVLSLGDRYKCSDGYAYTAPVAKFHANALGIHDLFGNVSEWMMDCSGGASTQLKDNGCAERVFRGTSWRDGPSEAPLEHHGDSDTDIGYSTVGFRVLREVSADNLPKSDK